MKSIAIVMALGSAISTAYAVDGATVYQAGKPNSCADCHGADGAGYPATKQSRKIPAIAGYPSKTVEIFLHANQKGYVTDGIKAMHERALKLTDEEITAVAKYVEGMHREIPNQKKR